MAKSSYTCSITATSGSFPIYCHKAGSTQFYRMSFTASMRPKPLSPWQCTKQAPWRHADVKKTRGSYTELNPTQMQHRLHPGAAPLTSIPDTLTLVWLNEHQSPQPRSTIVHKSFPGEWRLLLFPMGWIKYLSIFIYLTANRGQTLEQDVQQAHMTEMVHQWSYSVMARNSASGY